MPRTSAPKSKTSLDIWDRIEIIIERDGKRGSYVSRIEDIKANSIIASKPDFVDGGQLLTAHSRVFVQFLKPDAMYQFAANIKPFPGNSDGMVQLYSLGRVERVQRREFVRINIKLRLKYCLVKNESAYFADDDRRWFDSFSRDISAGGILMKVRDDIKKNDRLLVQIGEYEEIGTPRLLLVLCRRIVKTDCGNLVGVQFILKENLKKNFSSGEIEKLASPAKEFDSLVQNKLIRFVFDEQIEERRKGLI